MVKVHEFEVMLGSMITDGNVTNPNSKMKVAMLRKNSNLRKTKKDDTPFPKRPSEEIDERISESSFINAKIVLKQHWVSLPSFINQKNK